MAAKKKAKKKAAKKKAAKKPPVKKQPAKKRPPKKQPPKKQPPKKQPPKKPTTKGPAATFTPGICEDFTGSNLGTVCFKNIPAAGCTLTQVDSTKTYPFTPVTGQNANGLDYTDVAQGGCVTITVPAINKTYYYLVSVCPLDEAQHSVTVDT
jgi:hypothetical protein